MKRVCVVITARPSYSRVYSVLKALRARHDVKLQVIAAASALVTRYGRIVDQIRADGFEVSAEIPSVVEPDGLRESAVSTGLLLSQMAGILGALKPDVVVTVADRHETIATAIATAYQHIPLCHLLGGEQTGSIDDKVRHAITQLADIHCVATVQAGERVKQMSEGATVHVTGCPSIDLAAEALRLGPLPCSDVVVLQHSVTNEADQAGEQMRQTIEALRGMDVTWFWPGEDAGGQAMVKEMRLAGLHPIRNKPPIEFLRMLLGCKVLVGNSSVGIRECSFLGVPVVDIGSRQNDRELRGNVLRSRTPHDSQAIRKVVDDWLGPPARVTPRSTLYGDGYAGQRIAAILAERAVENVA